MELHPAIVHFPIALSLTAVLLHIFWLTLHREPLRIAALWNFDLAALTSVAAVLSGIWAEENAEAGGISKAAHDLLETHGALGYGAGGTLLGIALLRRLVPDLQKRLAPIYLGLIILAAALVGLNGYLGGRLVFEEGVGVRKSEIFRSQVGTDRGEALASGKNDEVLTDESAAEIEH